MFRVRQSNVKLVTDVNKYRHFFFICVTDFQVNKNRLHSVIRSERVSDYDYCGSFVFDSCYPES